MKRERKRDIGVEGEIEERVRGGREREDGKGHRETRERG